MARLARAVKPRIYTVIPSGGEAGVECISSHGVVRSLLHNKAGRIARLIRAEKRHYSTVMPSVVECIGMTAIFRAISAPLEPRHPDMGPSSISAHPTNPVERAPGG